jgi:beta-glucosidase
MNFPQNFIWGAATASYQIEGAPLEDGKQLSIWDSFTHEQKRIADDSTGDISCNSYHNYKQDIHLLETLGIQNYRFSVSWPRVLSYDADYKGGGVRGHVNAKGIAYYDRLIDGLLEKNITPWLTLYHWDLPLELERKGGFRNRDIMYWMGDYATLIAQKFGDRVKNYFTVNEMPCILGGYDWGIFAPGMRLSQFELLNIIHNLLLCHGQMTRALRAGISGKSNIGFAHSAEALYPASETHQDLEAYYAAQLSPSVKTDNGYRLAPGCITHWCDPIYFGDYPVQSYETFGKEMPVIKNGDMNIISTPIDFHGENIYNGRSISAAKENGASFQYDKQDIGAPHTAANWPVSPLSMYWLPKLLYDRYHKPIVISENGMSNTDYISEDGKVHDLARIEFTKKYLCELSRTIRSGTDVRGYFHWSLLDNFEWARGYSERFGLVYVDYKTGTRIPKDSSMWYKAVIRNNGFDL